MSDGETPEFFADGAQIAGSPFGLALTFLRSDPARPTEIAAASAVARIRLTPALARVIGEALVKTLSEPVPSEGSPANG